MKTPPSSSTTGTTAARIGTGLLFAGSGLTKITDPHALAEAITRYDLVSPALAQIGGHFLPWSEIVIGGALLLNVWRSGAWLSACGFSALFMVAVASAWGRGLDISCGCFATARTIDAASLLFNAALLAVTTWGLRTELRRATLRD
ncbi:MauE/DoxX family redox-associated membrane protein [Synoicihabitans lomoniglobus]|uniref:Methylamine utilisation protein MauE domain-containing protein n=1 Tax=Synoicihabitans lomoniglobus TaxID=2909285 RepID=A0AAE9ZVM0_9BACT|nr:hypothetical protein [Opitutaceae bacterium LMO-M01]WED63969.1 hypothetical protein PXH66_16650 [Opitutaceae bacterium LMO-M01]